MNKHEIQIASRKKMTEAIEPSSVRQKRIAKQTRKFLRVGGRIQKIPFGVSNNADSTTPIQVSELEKKRRNVKLL